MTRRDDNPGRTLGGAASSSRRDFLLGALATTPALALGAGCSASDSPDASPEGSGGTPGSSKEVRERLGALARAHVANLNAHDLDAVMGAYAGEVDATINAVPRGDLAGLRASQALFGFGGEGGALEGARLETESEYFTGEEYAIQGRILATHVGAIGDYTPSNSEVALGYTAFYRFDAAGKIVTERITMDQSPLTLGVLAEYATLSPPSG